MPTGTKVERAADFLFRSVPLGLAAALLLIGVAINLANVVGRYVLLASIYWAEEAMIYLSIWSIFLAAIAVAYDRADLTMDFFSSRLSNRWRRASDAAIALTSVLVCLFMAWQCIGIARVLIRNSQKTLALEIPMVLAQAALLSGFFFAAVAIGVRYMLREMRGAPTKQPA